MNADKRRIRAIHIVPKGNVRLGDEQIACIERAVKYLFPDLARTHVTQVIDPEGNTLRQTTETLVVFMNDPALYPVDKGSIVLAVGGYAVYGYLKPEKMKNYVVFGAPGSRFTYIERKHDKGWEADKNSIYSGKPFATLYTLQARAA